MVATLAIAAALGACGPSLGSDDDVFPRNCGQEGPVDLFEVADPQAGADIEAVGERYLVRLLTTVPSDEYWVVDRCGESRVKVATRTAQEDPIVDAVGSHVLDCDPASGELRFIDPEGDEPPRSLLSAVEGCRVVPVGDGVAVQQRGTATVTFLPDPSDPGRAPVVVTEDAQLADPDWIGCSAELVCPGRDPWGTQIRAMGDDLIVVLGDGRVLAFSATSLQSRVLHDRPISMQYVLEGDEHVIVRHQDVDERDLVIEVATGRRFEFCCANELHVHRFGDWLTYGASGPPYEPAPEQWINLRTHHLPTGTTREQVGRDHHWRPIAALGRDSLLVLITNEGGDEAGLHVFWPESGELRPVDLPGDDVWSDPARGGVFRGRDSTFDGIIDGDEERDRPRPLWWLGAADRAPELVSEDANVAFPTRHGRIVFAPTVPIGETAPLRVMLPDERVIDLDDDVLGVAAPRPRAEPWPVDRDEVLYAARQGDATILRRTVLP